MTYTLSEAEGDVFLIGGGASNVGDEAILSGLLKDWRESGNKSIDSITLVAHEPERTIQVHKDEFPDDVPIRPFSPNVSDALLALLEHDTFIVGGGGLFSSYMGELSKALPFYLRVATLLGKDVYWTAMGVYPSTPSIVMRGVVGCMAKSQHISVRDPISLETLQREGVEDVTLVPDPATTLSPDTEWAEKEMRSIGLVENDCTIGIAARRVKNERQNQRLQNAYQQAIEILISQGYQIVLLPFGNHPYEEVEMDHRVCQRYCEEYDIPMIQTEKPQKMLGVVSQVDKVISTRLHSMIFAYTVNTDFAAVEYAEKVTSLLDYYGKSENGIPLNEVTGDKMLSKIGLSKIDQYD
ncbi:hypothetical protein Z052_18225 [Halorubrum sp. C191]|uniref:polysaccharide pyruvyl transferase family protein n=1 Tax=Halorubrum sp. C191 TaxID=1383842 RepID=UPI000C076828|nr:polysaccharide pyruvyl transferase family protein [Halorubrum sp. C191]PHQ40808.1 hypothetical protein Z052_18225 [Halorubrum sp. C191]